MAEAGVKRAYLLGQAVTAITFKSKPLGNSVLVNKPNQGEFGSCV